MTAQITLDENEARDFCRWYEQNKTTISRGVYVQREGNTSQAETIILFAKMYDQLMRRLACSQEGTKENTNV